jgi:hypothetical protein
MYSPDIEVMPLHVTVTFGIMPYNDDDMKYFVECTH